MNAGFEAETYGENAGRLGVAGWSAPGVQGTHNLTSFQLTGEAFEGENVVFSNVVGGVIGQVLTTNLVGGQRYTLSVQVGERKEGVPAGHRPYEVQLLAGGVVLDSATTPVQVFDGWVKAEIVYYSPTDHPQIGQALEIRLIGGGVQLLWDDVQLTVEPSLTTDVATATTGAVECRTGFPAPQCSAQPYDTAANLAYPANGDAQPAVALNTISGHEAIHQPQYVNDGYYGNGSSWISASGNSWLKIDLGCQASVDSIRFGRDRLGSFDGRDPGQFTIHVAASDDVYANGNDANDATEYGEVFSSSSLGYDGVISGSETLRASFEPSMARYVKIQFQNGGVAIDEIEVAGEGHCPVITSITAPTDPVAVDTQVDLSAAFTDADAGDVHTCTIDWGDDFGPIASTVSGNDCTGNHAYLAAGVYTLTVTVTDGDGNSHSKIFEYVVVYDPAAGFVTGGGWIDSPAGAYAADPSLTGKATFGFVSKYKKGAITPDGNTRFEFSAADLRFASTSYQWLVISGPMAQYKGSGTINGTGDYGFMLTASDAAVNGGGPTDTFRLKIWDTATGDVVYDNGTNTPLGGGSIVIHTKK